MFLNIEAQEAILQTLSVACQTKNGGRKCQVTSAVLTYPVIKGTIKEPSPRQALRLTFLQSINHFMLHIDCWHCGHLGTEMVNAHLAG